MVKEMQWGRGCGGSDAIKIARNSQPKPRTTVKENRLSYAR
jgi:hypothetical protein